METLAEQIDQLESQIIDLIDDLDFYHYASPQAVALKFELDEKRSELLSLKLCLDQSGVYDCCECQSLQL